MAPQNEVSNISTFQQPYPHAEINGQPVRLMALGDEEGKSPVFLYVDSNGQAKWESQAKFTITDQNCQPSAAHQRTGSSR